MLPRDNRLTSDRDFSVVKKEGILFSSDSFSICYKKREDSRPSRFGFVISTKISLNAATRNKAKRALSEGVRQNVTTLKPSFDCVFLAKPIIVRKYTSELMEEVRQSLYKINLVK